MQARESNNEKFKTKEMNQNSYTKTQICFLCKKPLEKARVVDRGTAKCLECTKKVRKQHLTTRLARSKLV